MSGIIWLPSSDKVLRDISPICPLLWDAIEAGTVDAAHFFARKKHNPPSRTFYPMYTRYRIQTYLANLGLVTVNEEDVDSDLGMRALPNLGLQLKYHGYEIRIRKSDGAEGKEVPPAGPARKTQGYYRQDGHEEFYLPFEERDMQTVSGGNLLALWIPNAKLRLSNILLALPKGGGTTRASVQTHWIKPLPKPMVAAATKAGDDDLEVKPRRQPGAGDVADAK